MSRQRDAGRADVYAAELAAFDGTELEVVVPVDAVDALVAAVTTAPWWPPDRLVDVRTARRDATSSTTRWAHGRTVVSLAPPQRTPATVVHELAHVLAGATARHGPVFRRAHVDVAAAAFGPDRAAWLHDAYRSAGLAVAPRRWPAPPALQASPPSSAIAL